MEDPIIKRAKTVARQIEGRFKELLRDHPENAPYSKIERIDVTHLGTIQVRLKQGNVRRDAGSETKRLAEKFIQEIGDSIQDKGFRFGQPISRPLDNFDIVPIGIEDSAERRSRITTVLTPEEEAEVSSDEASDSDEDWEAKSARIARNLEREKRRKGKERVEGQTGGPSSIGTADIEDARSRFSRAFSSVSERTVTGSEASIATQDLKRILGRAKSGMDIDVSEREFRDALKKSPELKAAVRRAATNRLLEAGTIEEIRKELSNLKDVEDLTRTSLIEGDLAFKTKTRPVPKGKKPVVAGIRRVKPVGL